MLQRAFVMVVIIGPRWLNERIQDSADLHREEIRTALERGIRVFPVLVGGAHMPRPEELPEDLRGLATRQAAEVSDKRWDYDVEELIKEVELALADSPKRQRFVVQVEPLDPERWGESRWQSITDDPKPEDL